MTESLAGSTTAAAAATTSTPIVVTHGLPDPIHVVPDSHDLHDGESHGGGGHSHDHHDFSWDSTPSELMAGGVAGLSEHLVMFPFDTIKTRMQGSPERYLTIRSAAADIYQKGSGKAPLLKFYRGCGPTITAAVPAHACYFGGYEAMKRLVGADGVSTYTLSAIVATCGHDLVSTPFDVVKQWMQNDQHRQFNSAFQCFKHVHRTHGAFAFVASFPATAAMNIPQASAHWVTYETVTKEVLAPMGFRDESRSVIGGVCGGAAAAIASTPLDNVKTQVQLCKASTSEAFRTIYQQRGIWGFTNGVLPRICYMAPSAAIVMTTYEAMKVLLGA